MSTVDAAIIEYIVNGGSSGGGGDTTDEITLVKQSFYMRTHDGSHNNINFTNISVAMTGTIVKLYNTTTSKLESYVMVRMTPDSELKSDTSLYITNAHFISLDNDKIFEACVQTYGSGPNYCIHIIVPINTYADSWIDRPTPETAETGIYRMDKIGSTTLAKIVTILPQIVGSSSSSGGSSSGGGEEDVGTKVEGTYIQTSSIHKIYVKNIQNEADLSTGMLLNLKHLDSGEVHRYVLVRHRYTIGETPSAASYDDNAIVPLTEGLESHSAKIYTDDGDTYTIEIDNMEDGTYSSLDSASEFIMPTQISSKTLATILREQTAYFNRLNELIIYLEHMVEQLKQKAGL